MGNDRRKSRLYFHTLLEQCENRMQDRGMNDLIKDLAKVLHDLEWWQSSDSDEEDYRKTISEFKAKWFGSDPSTRRTEYINNAIEELRRELIVEFGAGDKE